MKLIIFCVSVLYIASFVAAQGSNEIDYYEYDDNGSDNFDYEEAQKQFQAAVEKSRENSLEENQVKNQLSELENNLSEEKDESDEDLKEDVVYNDNFEDNIETLDSVEESNSQEESANKEDPNESVIDYVEPESEEESEPETPIVEDEKKIFLETQEILNEDEKEANDFEEEKPEVSLEDERQENMQQIIDEANKILAEDDAFENSDEDGNSEKDGLPKLSDDLDEQLKKLIETMDKLTEEDKDDYDDYYQIDDSNLSDIFEQAENDSNDDLFESEPEADDDKPQPRESTPIMYGNDGLEAGDKADSEEVEVFIPSTSTIEDIQVTSEATTEAETQTKMVDNLSSSELDQLMEQFAILHSDELDVNSDSFARDVAPIHIKLSLDEPVVITSPNYPSPYPTNNVIDWILEGTDGMGIEFNITDFAVNGALGDYVLIKPGGVDASGNDGLIFSYRLDSERRYRFSDVNRMFIRFEAKLGMMFMRGFSFSVKLMTPLRRTILEDPDAEAVIAPPAETLKVFLAVSPQQFLKIKDDFRVLVADMAAAYITDNNIDPGLNTTEEITQLTGQSLCNVHWPSFDSCLEVTFGVPLQYSEDEDYRLNKKDLAAMWSDYAGQEPYASRLKEMGIAEFSIPDDDTILMLWLVIAAGVVISMALVAFALWRFSCFEDYTRMKTYSDTESIKSGKRDLDLYPTPHQTLPPLYMENEYKWPDVKYDHTTTVNMGGFANRNYVQDDLYDFDSDEDVSNRDRNHVSTPNDVYNKV